MRIDLTNQNDNYTCPPLPVRTFTGSALPVTLVGIRQHQGDGEVVAVRVSVTNADGVPFCVPCVRLADGWATALAATCFTRFGTVLKGFCVEVDLRRNPDTTPVSVKFAVADLDIKAASPTAEPGDPGSGFVRKGDDIYAPTALIEGVQHYAKQVMSYSPEMGAWGADWLGDYILVDGNYIPANQEGNQ